MTRPRPALLGGAIAALLVGGIAAAAIHADGPARPIAVATGSDRADTSTSVETTTTLPEPTTTTMVAATTTAPPTTTLRRAPSTTVARPVAAPTSATRAVTTTTPSAPGFTVSPASVGNGQQYTLTGTGCAGPNYGIGVNVYSPGGTMVDGNGGAAHADGTWSIPCAVSAGQERRRYLRRSASELHGLTGALAIDERNAGSPC